MDMREIALVGPGASNGRPCFTFTLTFTVC
jgi:hypothetical protein